MLRIDLYEVWTGEDHALTLTELVVKKKQRRRNFGYPKWADLGRRSVLPSTCWPDVGAIGMAHRTTLPQRRATTWLARRAYSSRC